MTKVLVFLTPPLKWFFFFNLDPSLKKCSNLRKKRLRLHSFGPLWTLSTDYQWEISEVGHLSCFIDFFVWFHIVCDRYTLDYVHFTFSDTIWPLSLSSDFGTRSCTHTDTASYFDHDPWMSIYHDQQMMINRWWSTNDDQQMVINRWYTNMVTNE